MTERGQDPREEETSLDESRLESLWRISTHSAQSIPELLDFALSEAVELTGSRIGYIYLYDEESGQFRLNTWSKEVMSQCTVVDRQTVYQLETTGIWGEAVRQRRPILVNDFAAPNPLKRGLPEGHAPLTRFLTIPVSSAGKIVAVIGVANKTLPYDHADIRQLGLMMESVWQVVERRRAEESLRQNEEKFRALFDTLIQGVVFQDAEGRIISANVAAERILGVPFEAMRGLTSSASCWQTIREDGSVFPGEEHPIPVALRTGREVKDVVHGIYNPQRQCTVWIRVTAVPLFREGESRPYQAYATLEDISERRATEAALRENEEKYRAIFTQATQGIYLHDLDGRILDANETACVQSGFTREELLQRTVFDNLPKTPGVIPMSTETILALWRAWPEGQRHLVEGAHVRKDGTLYPVEISTGSVSYGGRKLMLAVVQDITEKQRLAESLQQTSRLESLGVLAGGIAHDFNNLLGGVFGYVDLARMETRERETAEYLTRALAALQRSRGLTGQLLTFAKGGAPVKRIQSLFPLLEEAAQFALSGSATSCRFEVDPGLLPCDIDRNQIGQVIDNIIRNAEQAMAGGGVIEVTARNVVFAEREHPQLAAGHYVRLAIADRGVGIPAEYLARVFDPFYTTKPKGHGLGLATSYSIVRRHGGWIEVESEAGKGSVFSVYLPASAAAAPAGGGDPTGEHRGQGTFVVMDDEKVVRESVGKMLQSFGYAPVLKENGAEALAFFVAEHAAERPIAGMLFDLTVPGAMGGKEAIAAVRQICSRTPVFVISGYAEDPVMASPREYGFSGSICKPFIRADLARLLEEHLRAKP